MRTSAEYHVLAEDAYRRALAAVEMSVKDPAWSALPDQQAELQNDRDGDEPRLPAVILDVDETVLDNSAFQVENITTEPFQFSAEGWTRWCEREMATPVPGVLGFINGCRAKGVAIRYVTNRGKEVRMVTLNNLRKHGLVPDDETAEQELLCKEDRPEWGSDKTSRREFVAEQFRVVALIGDDLNDFLWAGQNATPEQRLAAASAADTLWGTRWFLLPNANYGGWEKALVDYKNGLTREEFNEMKLKKLNQTEPASGK
jgi:acid phosphatase